MIPCPVNVNRRGGESKQLDLFIMGSLEIYVWNTLEKKKRKHNI